VSCSMEAMRWMSMGSVLDAVRGIGSSKSMSENQIRNGLWIVISCRSRSGVVIAVVCCN
jgi:hypothetical protein